METLQEKRMNRNGNEIDILESRENMNENREMREKK